MKESIKIVLLGMLGTLLNVAFFVGLYYFGCKIPILLFMLLLSLVPGIINSTVYENVISGWELKRQLLLFVIMALITMICYEEFAYHFERSPGYAEFIITNTHTESMVPLKGRFYSVVQFMFCFMFNFALQFYLGRKRGDVIIKLDEDHHHDKRR